MTLDTGFKLRDVVGYEGNSSDGRNGKTYLISGEDISQEERCKKCDNYEFMKSEGLGHCSSVYSFDECTCVDQKYYLKEYNRKTIKGRERYGDIDVNKLAESCKDMCIFYKENCYNIESKHCLLRMILEHITYNDY